MVETGRLDEILQLKSVGGKHTRLITCMSDFDGSNATKQVPDTAKVDFKKDKATINLKTPYQSSRALLTRVGQKWPTTIVVQVKAQHQKKRGPTRFQIANGEMAVRVIQKAETTVLAGKLKEALDLGKNWHPKGFLEEGKPTSPLKIDSVQTTITDGALEIVVPQKIM